MAQQLWVADQNYFPQLRALALEKKLFNRRPWWVTFHLTLSLSGIVGAIALAAWIQHPIAIILGAVVAGLFSLFVGYVMHDAGHRQCSRSTAVNNILGFIASGSLGVPFHYWMDVHNEHHNNPNHEDDDPDVTVPLVAYSNKQVLEPGRERFRWLIAHQVWFYLPLLTLIPYSKRYFGLEHLAKKKSTTALVVLDYACVCVWHLLYYGSLFLLFGLGGTILFSFVHQALIGLFFGMVFAPNHKGMPIVSDEDNLDFFTRQVITARNFRSNRLIDFIFGGLNYQIEHHLFPYAPRYNLPRVSRITKQFCKERGIPYYETSLLRSYYEVYVVLRDVARYAHDLRQSTPLLRNKFNTLFYKAENDLARLVERARRQKLTPIEQQQYALAYEKMSIELAAMKQQVISKLEQDTQTWAAAIERLRQFMRQAKGRISA